MRKSTKPTNTKSSFQKINAASVKCGTCLYFQCDGVFAACAIVRNEDGNRSPEDSCKKWEKR